MSKNYSCHVKLVLLGESSVGKSSIVTRFTTGQFHKNQATIGAAFTTKTLSWQESEVEQDSEDTITKTVNFEIWDTAGQERYRSLAPMYYRNTDIALIVFNVADEGDMKEAQSWITELQTYMDESRKDDIIIKKVGNKVDLLDSKRINSVWDEAILVSARSGEGIDDLFLNIAKEIPLDRFTLGVTPSNTKGVTSNSVVELLAPTVKREGCKC